MKNLIITKLGIGDFNKAQEFYQNMSYQFPIDPQSDLWVAKITEEIVGIVRVCKENNFLVLRGMFVKPEFQKQGIGTQILLKVNEFLENKECFVLPHGYLEEFYGKIGFKKINQLEAPMFLQERIKEYIKTYPTIIVMKK